MRREKSVAQERRDEAERLWQLRQLNNGGKQNQKKKFSGASPSHVQVDLSKAQPVAQPVKQKKQVNYEAQAKENREKVLDAAAGLAEFAGSLAPAGVLSGLGAGGAAAAAAVAGNAVSADVSALLRSIIDALGEIVNILNSYAPALRAIIDDLGPALRQINDLVMQPYLGLVKDTEATMQKFRDDIKAGHLGPDAITPPISGPWKDWKRVASISTGLSLPFVGSVRKAEIGTVAMARYQAGVGRGWPSEYEMLQWAAGQPGILGPALSIADMMPAGKIPSWFLKN